jgi:hypothetical protein
MKKSCCSAATIEMAQTKQDSIKTQLTDIAKQRDQQITQCVKQIVPNLQKAVEGVQQGAQEVQGSTDATKKAKGQAIQEQAAPYIAAAQQVMQNADSLKTGFSDYQKKRATCYASILDMQGAAFCLACNADWSNNGVNQDGTINIHDTLCTRLKDDCFDFLRASLKQGPLVALKKVAGTLNGYRNMTQDFQGKQRDGNVGGEATMPPPPPPPKQLTASELTTLAAPGSDGTINNIPGGDPAGPARGAVGQAAMELGTTQNLTGDALKTKLTAICDNVIKGLQDAISRITAGGQSASLTNVIATINALITNVTAQKTAIESSADLTVNRNALSQHFMSFKNLMGGMTVMNELKALLMVQPAQQAADALSAASNYNNVPNGGNGIPQVQNGFVPEGPGQQEPKTPAGCDKDDSKSTCDWLCKNLIDGKTGKINLKAFGVGGIPNEDSAALPPSDPVPVSRLLQSGVTTTKWNPAKGEAGTSASFEENPAGVSTSDSSSAANLIATAFTAIMMAIAYIMI